MTEKQNTLRPLLKVTIHQPLLIMSKPLVTTQNGIILTF